MLCINGTSIIVRRKKIININIFSGPGTGKSTTAAGLFYHMKSDGYKVEYIQEYAKELTYGKDHVKLSDQLLLLGEQHHRTFRLMLSGDIDYIIHDSPFILGMVYADDKFIPIEEYLALSKAIYNRLDHINIFLKRDVDVHAYQQYGRSQSLDQAIKIDEKIKTLLADQNIPYHEVDMVSDTVQQIYNIVKGGYLT